MAGHSKWSNIKRKKGALDQKRGKIFTRCSHEISVAVKEGGGPDPAGNARLRLAIEKAKAVNVPNDTIDRAIKRGSGEAAEGEQLYELTYEGYGPGGAAVMVEVLTNNKNRTVGEVRSAFSKSGGSLGENGCVTWMFNKKAVFGFAKELADEDQVMEWVVESGAEDFSEEEEIWEVHAAPEDFGSVQDFLSEKVKLEVGELQQIPKDKSPVDSAKQDQMMRLLETLDDLDDVLNVYTNADFPEES